MPFWCRFAFKTRFFIFHGATESDGCGKTVSTFYDRVWIFSSMTRRSKLLFLLDETVRPRRDYRMVGQSALGRWYFRHSRETPREKVSSLKAKSLLLKGKRRLRGSPSPS